MSEFEIETGQAKTTFDRKPLIKKGYYVGELREIKARKDKDGNDVLGKFDNKQVILMFEVQNEDGIPVGYKDKVVELPFLMNIAYKDKKTGLFNSAITPKSQTTEVLKAMGWEFKEKSKVDLKSFIGKKVELNIDDYDAKDNEGTYKASAIKDIKKLENTEVVETKVLSDKEKKLKDMEKLVAEGLLSKEGFETAKKQLGF